MDEQAPGSTAVVPVARGGFSWRTSDDPYEVAGWWAELEHACSLPFASEPWLAIWSRHARGGRGLLAACSLDGRLVALVPLRRTTVGGVRLLRLAAHDVSDRAPVVCTDADERLVPAALRAVLDGLHGTWDLFVADHVAVGQPWRESLPAAVLRTEPSPVLHLHHRSWEEYLASRSRHMRQWVRRTERRLHREHELSFRLADDPARLDHDLDELLRLHALRFGPRTSFLAAQDFHRELAAVALARGWLRLWLLEVDGVSAAAWYGFRYGGRHWFYQSGRDPQLSALDVGNVLLVHTIRDAIASGSRDYCFLRGGETYKSRFADEVKGDAVQTLAVAGTRRGQAVLSAVDRLSGHPRGRALVRRVAG